MNRQKNSQKIRSLIKASTEPNPTVVSFRNHEADPSLDSPWTAMEGSPQPCDRRMKIPNQSPAQGRHPIKAPRKDASNHKGHRFCGLPGHPRWSRKISDARDKQFMPHIPPSPQLEGQGKGLWPSPCGGSSRHAVEDTGGEPLENKSG